VKKVVAYMKPRWLPLLTAVVGCWVLEVQKLSCYQAIVGLAMVLCATNFEAFITAREHGGES
jgi:hypothetical protein